MPCPDSRRGTWVGHHACRPKLTSLVIPRCGVARNVDYEHAQLARRPPWRTRPRRSRVRPSSLCFALMEQVERGAERAASRAVAIAHKRMADDLGDCPGHC